MTLDEQVEFLKKRAHDDPYKNRAWCTGGFFKNSFVFKSTEPLKDTDIRFFNEWFHGKDIKDYVFCYVPYMGYKFIEKSNLDDRILFVLGAEKRRTLLWLLAKGDEAVMNRYLKLWETHSKEIEYQLWLYNDDKINSDWYRQSLAEMEV